MGSYENPHRLYEHHSQWASMLLLYSPQEKIPDPVIDLSVNNLTQSFSQMSVTFISGLSIKDSDAVK